MRLLACASFRQWTGRKPLFKLQPSSETFTTVSSVTWYPELFLDKAHLKPGPSPNQQGYTPTWLIISRTDRRITIGLYVRLQSFSPIKDTFVSPATSKTTLTLGSTHAPHLSFATSDPPRVLPGSTRDQNALPHTLPVSLELLTLPRLPCTFSARPFP